jgi:hypothetical protein
MFGAFIFGSLVCLVCVHVMGMFKSIQAFLLGWYGLRNVQQNSDQTGLLYALLLSRDANLYSEAKPSVAASLFLSLCRTHFYATISHTKVDGNWLLPASDCTSRSLLGPKRLRIVTI